MRISLLPGCLVTAVLVLFSACLHSPVALKEPPEFQVDFSEIWLSFQYDFPLFVHKDINWLEFGDEYYYLVNECSSMEEFYSVLGDMLAQLEDRTIGFETFEGDPDFPVPPEDWVFPWQNEYTSNVDSTVLVNNYLNQYSFVPCTLGVAFCDPELLPYMMLSRVPWDFDEEAIFMVDSFVALCNDLSASAVILDLRIQNQRYGHSDSVAGRFTGETYSSITLRSRDGPDYWNYFDNPQTVRRAGPEQFTGTVIVLMGEQNRGINERLCAEFGYNSKAVLVGETTMGSVSEIGSLITTNWIHVRVPDETVMMRDGTWLEGAGVPVDIYVETSPGDFAAGVDPVIEYAIELLDQYR